MRNCGVAFGDLFITPPPPFWGFSTFLVLPLHVGCADTAPPISGEALNGDFFTKLAKLLQGSPERGAGKPNGLTEGSKRIKLNRPWQGLQP